MRTSHTSPARALWPLLVAASCANSEPSHETPVRDAALLPQVAARTSLDAALTPEDASDPSGPRDAGDAGAIVESDAGDATGEADAGRDLCTGTPHPAFVADPRLCVSVFASDLNSPRQMAFARNGDLLVNEGVLTVLWDANEDGTSDSDERSTFAEADGLNHGVAFDREQHFVYASSRSTVYRWPYQQGQRASEQPAQVVVKNIPSGGHATRTLVFDASGRLYVSVGSHSNVDVESELLQTRSQIRRFELGSDLPDSGIDYAAGEVVASGMRNQVGLFIDADDQLWGVENGRDQLHDDDLGGDIHNDNPAEEINLVDGRGTSFYGYPFCYSEFKVSGGAGPGTQWADPSLDTSIRKTDAWCRDLANARPPMFAMQAHYAPLGIIQYTGHALPFHADFIVTAHGSWNRNPAVGRLLLRARYANGAISSVEPIVGGRDSNGELDEGGWDARPVDVQQGPDQALYVSDDAGGRVFKVGYR